LAIVVLGVLYAPPGEAEGAPVVVIQRLPDDLHWSTNPKLHGLQTVVLAGDPNVPEPYAQRIKLPPNYRLEPHSHSNDSRMVTVLSGTFYFAYGETFDETKLRAFGPGGFFTEPKGVSHFAVTKEEVILQLNAVGPDGTKSGEAKR
jgi:quercetin dioxygenase-like cupin family protein